jgi:hypothetical protein
MKKTFSSPCLKYLPYKEKSDGKSSLLALHRFASRGRLFSRETSTDDTQTEQTSTSLKILRHHHTISSSGASSIASTIVGTMINMPDSGLRDLNGNIEISIFGVFVGVFKWFTPY